MFQGFYNLASGMLTQNQNLNVISNNMVNNSTPGYKADAYTSTTFRQEMFYRMGNVDKGHQTQIGQINMARVGAETVTDYEAGAPQETAGILDFAIQGDGFFKVAAADGGFVYTRNGSFYVDEEGCLALKGIGRVQGQGGDIVLDSDNIMVDSAGGIYYQNAGEDGGEALDNLALVDFADYTQLTKGANGTFTTGQAEIALGEEGDEETAQPTVLQGYLERSNVDPIKEMSNMITSQRALQSAAQVLKIYDQIMGKAVTEIGKL